MGLPRMRFSILRLMALVLLIAVGLAAAMAGAFPFTVVTLSATTIGAVLSQGSSRAFFLGCTVFGWASILLAFGAGPDIRSALPTTPHHHPDLRSHQRPLADDVQVAGGSLAFDVPVGRGGEPSHHGRSLADLAGLRSGWWGRHVADCQASEAPS